jgi:hypothetical protein
MAIKPVVHLTAEQMNARRSPAADPRFGEEVASGGGRSAAEIYREGAADQRANPRVQRNDAARAGQASAENRSRALAGTKGGRP